MDKISLAVLNLLEFLNISDYPINPLSVVKKLENSGFHETNIMLSTYSEYSKFSGKSLDYICEKVFNSKDGASAFDIKDNKCLIIYNDAIKNSMRIRFTIAHELGHVLLNHHTESSKNEAFAEAEADLFAQNLLCHPLILKRAKIKDYEQVSKSFKISNHAAKVVLNSTGRIFNQYDHKILDRFYNFVHTKKCKLCHKIFICEDAEACPVCAYRRLEFYHSAENCYQKNYCKEDAENCEKENICESCGKILGKDFRYCPVCKTQSLYFKENILQEWDFK